MSNESSAVPKTDEEITSSKQNSLFVHIDKNSSDNLQELFDSVLKGDSKRPLQVPFRMRKLPNSFFNPPLSSTAKPTTTTVSHSRANSDSDSAYEAGSQSSINQAVALRETDKTSTSVLTQTLLSPNGLPICHSRAHSSPASLQQNYKFQPSNDENTSCTQDSNSFPVTALNFPAMRNSLKCGEDRLKQSPPIVFHGKQRSYDVVSPIQLQNDFGSLPPGWEQAKTNDGQIYYLNHLTKTTQWEDPRIQLKLQASQQTCPNEAVSFVQETPSYIKANSKNVQKGALIVPDNLGPLPEGWEQALTETGDVYFINHNNRTTSWNDPRISSFVQKTFKGNKSEMNWFNARPFGKVPDAFKEKQDLQPLSGGSANIPMDSFLSGESHGRQESGDSGLSLSSNTFSVDFVAPIDDSMDGLSESGTINPLSGLECPDNLVSSLQLRDDVCTEMFTDVHNILTSSNKPENLEWYKIN